MLKHINIHTLSEKVKLLRVPVETSAAPCEKRIISLSVSLHSTDTSLISQTFLECTVTDFSCLHVYLQALVRRGENSHVWENEGKKKKNVQTTT